MAYGVIIRSIKKEKERGSLTAIWLGPDQRGYVDCISDAGVYDDHVAQDIVDKGTPLGNMIIAREHAKSHMMADGRVLVANLPVFKIDGKIIVPNEKPGSKEKAPTDEFKKKIMRLVAEALTKTDVPHNLGSGDDVVFVDDERGECYALDLVWQFQ